jgi:glycosyltransferase involved in cell wall biosynthesis
MLTVVIASYKYGHLAAHCIESVLSQTVKPERILFVDDGAGDCSHLPKLYNNVEFVLRYNNMGVVSNFNDMLHRVTSEYVMFVGADNWLRSDTVERVLKPQTDIVTYDIVVTGELKNEILNRHKRDCQPYHGDHYWSRKNMHHGSMVYKTALGKSCGYTSGGGNKTEEDLSLWEKMRARGATVSHIPEGLLYYRRHKENFYKY